MLPKIALPVLLVVLVLLCADAHAAKRVALVIGNAAYASSPLRNPANDATDVAAALRGLGFEVICRTDADRRAMVDAVRDLGSRAQGAEAAFFFYAGHGMQVRGANYLIPVDADVGGEDEVEFEAMDANRILAKMESAGARVNIIILDACRDNPFRSFRSATRGLAVVRAVTGSVVVYATAPGDVAADGKGRNSPFTAHLLKHMGTRGVRVDDVFRRVGKGVARESKGGQSPWISSSLYDDFYLAGAPQGADEKPATTQDAGPKPDPPQTARSGQVDTWTDPTSGMEFAWVPGGCFKMGSPSSESWRQDDEGPVHEVCVDGFWMGRHEATLGQFRAFARRTGYRTDAEKRGGAYVLTATASVKKEGYHWDRTGFEQDDTHPVVMTSWNDAAAYAKWLSGTGNGTFRLPTEAEWEYAARAGTATARFWGDDPDRACRYANVFDRTSKRVNAFGWPAHDCDDGYAATAPVGSFEPNAFGLYDMLGNVWEWCADVYDEDAYLKHARHNPLSSHGSIDRVVRGGCCELIPSTVRSAMRNGSDPGVAGGSLGFRLLRTE